MRGRPIAAAGDYVKLLLMAAIMTVLLVVLMNVLAGLP
jgi:hypothetical protein